jgi:Transglutaminase-like superfamily
MGIKTLIIFIFFSIAIDLNAQWSKIKFGQVSIEELNMKKYDKDSTASAVVLFDYGELNLGEFKFYRYTKIKIFTKDGYEFANSYLPIFGGEDLSTLKAATYNMENGKIVATSLYADGKFKEEFVEGIDIIKWAMPNVKEGSIIEYKYEISGSGIRGWEFQRKIPSVHSEYSIKGGTLGAIIKLNISMQGYYTPMKIGDDHWVMKDVPAFIDEPFINSYQNYIAKINLELAHVTLHRRYLWQPSATFFLNFISEWPDIGKQIERSFFKNDKVIGTDFLYKLTVELVKNCKHPDEKVRAIHSFVRSSMEWNERNSTLIRQRGLKKVFEEKIGTSGEINWIMLAMMRHAGLPSDAVLISTRDNGFIRQEVPNKNKFNHLIVMTDYEGEKKMIDATNKLLSIDFLPESCLNGLGYWAKPVGFEWVELKNKVKVKTVYNIDAQLSKEGKLGGSVSATKNGCAASDARKQIKADQKKYLSELFKGVDFDISQDKVENLDNLSSPITETYHFTLNDFAQTTKEVIYFKPVFISNLIENPFHLETRVYPVDFAYPNEIVYLAKFNIPDGYNVEELPQPKMLILPENAGKFVFNVNLQNKTITVVNQFVLNKSMFVQSEYPQLREFYNQIVAKQAEQIVLKKK